MTRLPRRLIFIFVAAVAVALIAVAGFGASFAWTRYTASLGPLDLAASREGSTIVVDRDGRLLRPFTLPDGRWRLPATTHDVDPRYIAMLVAYEDGRFYQHDGVDLRALVRAGAQWLDARPCGVGRLDLAHAGRAADRAAARAHDRAPSSGRSRGRSRSSATSASRERSIVISRLRRSAAISRACGRPRSPISARSR